ncbi:MAG TPA: guanylate kinase [Gemmatimonadales bacterium]|nr:guanylate kinase [Gemmatimonadales bacterium]
MTPRVVILSAPSGGGKTTISQALLARRPDVGYSVSATTRPPRPGERDGESYHFVTRAEFDRLIAAREFLEWAEYAGNRYGTLRREVRAVLAAGKHVLLDIEVQGARQVQQECPPPESISVFVLPPDPDTWIERLVGRETEVADVLARRLQRATEEIQESVDWEHVVINDDLDAVVAEVGTIIDEDGKRPHRPPIPRLVRLVEDLVSAAERHQPRARTNDLTE